MMKLSRRALFAALCVLALAMVLGACGDDEEVVGSTLSQGQLRFGESFPGELIGELPEPIENPQVSDAEFMELVSNNTDFAFEMYERASIAAPGDNTFFSPHSISVAFALALPVSNDSEPIIRNVHLTQDQAVLHPAMNRLLSEYARHADVEVEPGEDGEPGGEAFVLNMPNGVWVDEGLVGDLASNEELLTIFGGHYDAPVASLPFETAPSESEDLINAWVSDQTNGLIPKLMNGNIKSETYYVLVNAIYFKASWKTAFSPFGTADAAFQAPGGEVQAETMVVTGPFSYAKTDDYEAVALPYISDGMQMVVVMPNDFETFESSWSPSTLDEVLASFSGAELYLKFPKFKIGARLNLTPLLEDPFSSAIHEANIDLDEMGTSASAATAVEVGGNNGSEYQEVQIDRPFMFLIRDTKTGAILFMGRVLNPNQ